MYHSILQVGTDKMDFVPRLSDLCLYISKESAFIFWNHYDCEIWSKISTIVTNLNGRQFMSVGISIISFSSVMVLVLNDSSCPVYKTSLEH